MFHDLVYQKPLTNLKSLEQKKVKSYHLIVAKVLVEAIKEEEKEEREKDF